MHRAASVAPQAEDHLKRFLPYLILIIASATVYLPAVNHGFVGLDDPVNVSANPIFNGTDFGLMDLLYFWRKPYAGLYIPVTYSTWGVESLLCKLHSPASSQAEAIARNPVLFHAGNILLHVCNTLLVYVLLGRFVPGIKGPLFGALLFGVHPLHAETVAWVTETKGLLSAGFSLLTYLQFLAATESKIGKRQGLYFLLATILFFLAMLSKPTAISLPLVIAAVQLLLRRYTPSRLWAGLCGWAVFGLLMTALTQQVQSQSMLDVMPTSIVERVVIAGDAVVFYATKLIYPVALMPDYSRTPQWVLSTSFAWYAWLIPAIVILAAGVTRHRGVWMAAIAMFVLSLAPVLGFIPFGFQAISTVADRYTYVALLGPAFAFAIVVARSGNVVTSIAATIIVVCSIQSYHQTLIWRNDRTLFEHTLAVNDRSVLAANALGNVEARAGNLAQAIGFYEQAIKTDPTSAEAWLNLGLVYERQGQRDLALYCCDKALEYRPGYMKAQHAVARGLIGSGRLDEAVMAIDQLLENSPNYFPIRYQLGEAYLLLGELNAAAIQYRLVLDQEPGELQAYTGLATVLGRQGQWKEAADALAKAVQMAPDSAENWFNLGTALLESGQAKQAVDALRTALKIRPDDEKGQQQLIRALEMSGTATASGSE